MYSMSDLTPLMNQYREIKRRYLDSILLFRMGDFYEMFDQDAVTASKVLDITLTARNKSKGIETPLCGFPYHAADGYIAKLIRHGFKVAVCEQVEDPKLAKGIVRREVIRVVTPGTVLDASILDAKDNNYLAAVYPANDIIGLALLDISTGDFIAAESPASSSLAEVDSILSRFTPREFVLPNGRGDASGLLKTLYQYSRVINHADDWTFDPDTARRILLEHFKVSSLDGFGVGDFTHGIAAAGAALRYIQESQKTELSNIRGIKPFRLSGSMILDATCQRNLELVKNTFDGTGRGALISVLDHTETAMGGRRLRQWLLNPLLDTDEINARLDAVVELKSDPVRLAELKRALGRVHDLERLISRATLGAGNARDLLALKRSFSALPDIKGMIQGPSSRLLSNMINNWDDLSDIYRLIDAAINDDPPYGLREGRLIKKGYSPELDALRLISSEGKGFIASIEQRERERTGISSLKVSYNKVFGYYIEVTKANLQAVPGDYIRKQTLTNAERFITQELKDYEEKVLGAEEKILDLEYRLFNDVRQEVASHIVRIQDMAGRIGLLDCLCSLAEVAQKNNYTRPVVNNGDIIRIAEGRHPVIELVSEERFVPNDTFLTCSDNQMIIITGPNMAGKSTYMRQVALIVIMAQMGSLVPAGEAEIGIVDRVFTRVGASDFLARGQSTFMVEMNETADILHNATKRSLIVLDEIGRGTSTFDGMSIAWAVAEYIHDKIGARTLFATHYHELTDLALTLPRVKNYTVAVKEWGDRIIFLRRVIKGGADKSYGIQVARLAGLPLDLISRAKEVLSNLEKAEFDEHGRPAAAGKDIRSDAGLEQDMQLRIFGRADAGLAAEIRALDLDAMTPIEALNKLLELKKKAEGTGL